MIMKRRQFLKATLGTSALAPLVASMPNVLSSSAGAATAKGIDDTILVVVQLSGGNDGLNTVVPYADDVYARNRPTLRLLARNLHRIDDYLGFHPHMKPFNRLYKEGQLSIIQGVGSPVAQLDHDAAMRIWHSAAPKRPECPTGWLGRTADHLWKETPGQSSVAFVGPITRPFALKAERVVVPCIHKLEDLSLHQMSGEQSAQMSALRIKAAGHSSPFLDYVQHCQDRSHANGRRVRALMSKSSSQSGYPSHGLAKDLQLVAQLIRADTGMRVFFTELGGGGIGGFDNHANQLGNHCALLAQLAESIAAFTHDLQQDKLLDRVLLMTFSEFGRTVKENGRRGTGHAVAAPIFLVGGRVKGGLTGAHPSLTDLDQGGLKMHTDFRQVFATVLDQWLELPSRDILGQSFEALDIIKRT
jgi:uncharacterized protein (DUF1501 family)